MLDVLSDLVFTPSKWYCCFQIDGHFNYSAAGSVNYTKKQGDNSHVLKVITVALQA